MKFIVKLNFGQTQNSGLFTTPSTVTLISEADSLVDIVSKYTQENMFSVQTHTGIKIINPRNVNWIDIDEFVEEQSQKENGDLNKVFPSTEGDE